MSRPSSIKARIIGLAVILATMAASTFKTDVILHVSWYKCAKISIFFQILITIKKCFYFLYLRKRMNDVFIKNTFLPKMSTNMGSSINRSSSEIQILKFNFFNIACISRLFTRYYIQ
jgi:hypothetical protein